MNDQTAALLQGLADKLGTTTTYLWSVMLKQAPVAATITVVELTLTAIVATVLWRCRVAIGKRLQSWFETEELTAFIACAVFVIVSVVWIIAMIISIEHAVTAIFNPEYWALDKVLSALKPRK